MAAPYVALRRQGREFGAAGIAPLRRYGLILPSQVGLLVHIAEAGKHIDELGTFGFLRSTRLPQGEQPDPDQS
ncbi:hypothetical protein D3C72_2443330 [compost metagenome]